MIHLKISVQSLTMHILGLTLLNCKLQLSLKMFTLKLWLCPTDCSIIPKRFKHSASTHTVNKMHLHNSCMPKPCVLPPLECILDKPKTRYIMSSNGLCLMLCMHAKIVALNSLNTDISFQHQLLNTLSIIEFDFSWHCRLY